MPRTLIITRHVGAVEWIRRHFPVLFEDGEVIASLTPSHISALSEGDIVVGVLPISLINECLEKGARVALIQFAHPPRGAELSADAMEAAGASLMEVLRLDLAPFKEGAR